MAPGNHIHVFADALPDEAAIHVVEQCRDRYLHAHFDEVRGELARPGGRVLARYGPRPSRGESRSRYVDAENARAKLASGYLAEIYKRYGPHLEQERQNRNLRVSMALYKRDGTPVTQRFRQLREQDQ